MYGIDASDWSKEVDIFKKPMTGYIWIKDLSFDWEKYLKEYIQTLDFENTKKERKTKMNKADLKPGMKVVLKNGDEYFVTTNNMMTSVDPNRGGWFNLSTFDDGLRSAFDKYSVSKVYSFCQGSWEEVFSRTKTVVKNMELETPTMDLKIIISGDKTTVILPDGTKASTIREDPDTYSEETGISVALYKALIKQLRGNLTKIRKQGK